MAVGGSVIGALRVVLGADTAVFETGLKKAEHRLGKFAGNMTRLGVSLGAAALSLTAGIVKGSLASADAMLEASQRAGLSFKAFQQMSYAASLAGVSAEQLETSMAMLGKKMGETAADSTKALGKIGIAVSANGKLKETIAIVDEIADRYMKAGSAAERARILTTAFGRSGMMLAPMFAEGAEGLRRVREEASRLGLVLDEDLARKADVLNDQMTTFGRVIRMNFQAGVLQGFLKDAKDLRSVFSDPQFINGIRQAGLALGQFAAFAVKHSREIVAVTAGITAMFLATQIGAKGVVAAVAGLGAGIVAYIAQGQIATTETGNLSDALSALRGGAAGTGGIINEQANKIRESNEALIRQKGEWEKLTQALYLGEDAHRRMKEAIELVNEARELGLSAGTREGEMWMRNAIAAKQAEHAYTQVAERMQAVKAAGQQVGQTLENAFVDTIVEGKKLKDVLADLLKSFARMAAQMAFRAMFGGPFGMGLPGMASGGSFTVGGSGAIDSQLVAFKATPGEHVSVTRQNETPGGGMAVVNNYFQDFRNVDSQSRAFVASQIRASEARAVAKAPGAVARHRSTNPNYLRSGL